MTKRGCFSDRTRIVFSLCERPSGAGIKEVAQAIECSDADAAARLGAMIKRGHAFKVKRWREVRYFRTQELADAWDKANPDPRVLAQQAKQRAKLEKAVPVKKYWPLTLPGTPKRVETPTGPRIVFPDDVKVTKCPDYTHNHRFQCAPGEQPFGAGFSAVGIGRNVDTGRAWG